MKHFWEMFSKIFSSKLQGLFFPSFVFGLYHKSLFILTNCVKNEGKLLISEMLPFFQDFDMRRC